MAKKKPAKPQAPIRKDPNDYNPITISQFKIEKAVEDDKKVRPKQVFVDYKEPQRQGSTGEKSTKKKVIKGKGKGTSRAKGKGK